MNGTYSDAAKRLADAYNLHRIADINNIGRWLAVRLADGSNDGTLYDSKRDAVRHQLDEFLCAYLPISPKTMSYKEAEAYLSFTRKAYDSGFRMPDPDSPSGGPDMIRRLTREEETERIRALFKGRMPRAL
jgi:hypothetical protein